MPRGWPASSRPTLVVPDLAAPSAKRRQVASPVGSRQLSVLRLARLGCPGGLATRSELDLRLKEWSLAGAPLGLLRNSPRECSPPRPAPWREWPTSDSGSVARFVSPSTGIINGSLHPKCEENMNSTVDPVLTYISAHERDFVDDLREFLRIPSISTESRHAGDVRRCAEFVAEDLRRAGLQGVEILPTAGHPAVYAEWLG